MPLSMGDNADLPHNRGGEPSGRAQMTAGGLKGGGGLRGLSGGLGLAQDDMEGWSDSSMDHYGSKLKLNGPLYRRS